MEMAKPEPTSFVNLSEESKHENLPDPRASTDYSVLNPALLDAYDPSKNQLKL